MIKIKSHLIREEATCVGTEIEAVLTQSNGLTVGSKFSILVDDVNVVQLCKDLLDRGSLIRHKEDIPKCSCFSL